ncbi:hypothetical protein BB560_005817 [Smittium megazygosporum]|uniref:Ceramide very long chain fatty acid hydroxylase n=1 Tax=Smittium megazygosporum TaxID=133381 RepID=A0A2T9YVD8_9FUNG|nr:hypothetical protein BB560_005817 [Smittium megazygosporum]
MTKESPSKPEYSRNEVATHNSVDSLWVIFSNKVYDITSFVPDHPGGIEWLAKFGGQDISFVMGDEDLHAHTQNAYNMLFSCEIGVIKKEETWKNTKLVFAEIAKNPELAQFDMVGTPSKDFLDPNKPLFSQIWNSNFSKEFYIQQVHIPRHIAGNAVLFENKYLEKFTMTPWYLVPMVWLPMIYLMWSIGITIIPRELFYKYFITGVVVWPLFEYSMHRFIFHFDRNIPDGTIAQVTHFMLHGFHHFLPMDSMRLVMPPALSCFIGLCVYTPLSYIIPPGITHALFCGLALMYIVYDETHYWLHHGYFKYDFIKRLKSFHLEHHYRVFNRGYGVTSDLWDRVFGTTFDDIPAN